MVIHKPYLIIPTLIEQPTWGGQYIVAYKHWDTKKDIASLSIGQSYELSGNSLLTSTITDSDHPDFQPHVLFASKKIMMPSCETMTLQRVIASDPSSILGPNMNTMPILIKFTQAKGNSFQLHIPTNITSPQWKTKPESWYFFEKGCITLGVKKEINLEAYRTTCIHIEEMMKVLSSRIQEKTLSLEEGKKEAQLFIQKENPWQFVNCLDVKAGDCVDLSRGGIHHSWEENTTVFPEGNIVYEVQKDVNDASSTIRSFDQGKIKDDGTIRTIHINDYFTFIDTDPIHNDPSHILGTKQGTTVFNTPYYTTEIHTVTKPTAMTIGTSFVHLFVQKGTCTVETSGGTVRLTQGHSCFIPWISKSYVIHNETPTAEIIQTYIAS